jgi:m7GpppX diphosphatase
MFKIEENTKQTFIPSGVISFDNVRRVNQIMSNGIYEKYDVVAEVSGQLIICNDITKLKKSSKTMKKETYEEYIKSLELRDPKKDEWIYNIIDGTAEQDKIIYKDDQCIVIPTYIWDETNIEKMHVLCLPIDKTIRSIRSLEVNHIPLLEHMKKVSLKIIEEKYNLTSHDIKMFFHYEPSTYHLHIHFVNISYRDCGSSVEYSHELDSVIFNLSLDSDYYKKICLNKRSH